MHYNKNKRQAIAILDYLMRGLRIKKLFFESVKINYLREKKIKRIVQKRIKKIEKLDKLYGLQTLLKNFINVQNLLKLAFDFNMQVQSDLMRNVIKKWKNQVKLRRIEKFQIAGNENPRGYPRAISLV